MEDYFAAKATLFEPRLSVRAVVNADDEFGRRLLASPSIPMMSFAIEAPADVNASSIRLDRAGSTFVARVDGASFPARVRIAGRFNVSNALAAIAAGRALGLPIEKVAEGIASVRGVPGRFEAVDAGQDFTVLVDYAHTPDSLEVVLRTAREITPAGRRLVCVFGCGGDRDRSKRPRMGRIATSIADRTMITSDNPRSEDPRAIIDAIEQGARAGGGAYDVEPDRREAIRAALRDARAGDVILIAGKGHETYQEIAGRVLPFDDREIARAALEERCSG
jgi:UDP-N-acetylmuramoyl-L-alanyl-D-glutamate--2,6-diaminopimelate ligase